MKLSGTRKVVAIEQAMAFGFLSYWKGRESMECCSKICTVLARCLVFYLHMHVYMLFGVVMLKPTFRYIELVNPLFRINVSHTFKILPMSRSAQIGFRTELSSNQSAHRLATNTAKTTTATHHRQLSSESLSTMICPPCHNAARLIRPYSSVSTDGPENHCLQKMRLKT